MGADPIGNNSRIEGSFDFGAKQQANNSDGLVKSASDLVMNSPLEEKSRANELSQTPLEGGKALVTLAEVPKDLSAVSNISVLKKFESVGHH